MVSRSMTITIEERTSDGEDLADIFFLKIGSTLTLDYLYLFLGTSLAFSGFILNWISFEVFRKIKLHNKILRKYLLVYTFSSSLSCFIFIFAFLAKSPRLFSISLTYAVSFLRCKIIAWNFTISFFLNLLDFCILMERISYFKPNLKKCISHNPYLVSAILFLTVNVINLTNVLVEDPRTADEYMDAIRNPSKYPTFRYCKPTPFTKTLYGQIIMLIVVSIKHLLTLIVELIMSIYSIVLFRKFLKEKAEYFKCSKKKNSNNDISSNSTDDTILSLNTPCLQMTTNFQLQQISADSPFYRLILYNSRLTKMTIYLIICSLASHTAIVLASVLFVRGEETTTVNYCYVAILVFLFLKHISNFILFYRFNRTFRKYLTNRIKNFILQDSVSSD